MDCVYSTPVLCRKFIEDPSIGIGHDTKQMSIYIWPVKIFLLMSLSPDVYHIGIYVPVCTQILKNGDDGLKKTLSVHHICNVPVE